MNNLVGLWWIPVVSRERWKHFVCAGHGICPMENSCALSIATEAEQRYERCLLPSTFGWWNFRNWISMSKFGISRQALETIQIKFTTWDFGWQSGAQRSWRQPNARIRRPEPTWLACKSKKSARSKQERSVGSILKIYCMPSPQALLICVWVCFPRCGFAPSSR